MVSPATDTGPCWLIKRIDERSHSGLWQSYTNRKSSASRIVAGMELQERTFYHAGFIWRCVYSTLLTLPGVWDVPPMWTHVAKKGVSLGRSKAIIFHTSLYMPMILSQMLCRLELVLLTWRRVCHVIGCAIFKSIFTGHLQLSLRKLVSYSVAILVLLAEDLIFGLRR